jgi:hypothetical protein
MRKQIKRIAAALLATGMLLCAMPLAAFAEDTVESVELGHKPPIPTYPTSITLQKYLNLGMFNPGKADVPYANCEFELSAVDIGNATTDNVDDSKGWIPATGVFTPNYQKTQNVTFKPNDNNTSIFFGAAVKDLTYDFASMLNANMYKAGYVYRYKITETNAQPGYIEMDANNKECFVNVYVENASWPMMAAQTEQAEDTTQTDITEQSTESVQTDNASLENSLGFPKPNSLRIAKIICYTVKGNKICKEFCFKNDYKTTCLDLTKVITGNQGDKSKKFQFTVVIDTKAGNPMKDYKMYINGNDSSLIGDLVVGSDGKATRTGTMTNYSHVKIDRIPKDAYYTITEGLDGYTLTITGAKINQAKNGCEDRVKDNKNIITFTNDKHGDVPTGVMLDVAPYALMVGLALAGLAGFTIRKRRVQ